MRGPAKRERTNDESTTTNLSCRTSRVGHDRTRCRDVCRENEELGSLDTWSSTSTILKRSTTAMRCSRVYVHFPRRSTKTTKPERDHGAGGSNPRHLFNGVNHNGTTTNWRQGHDRCRTPAPAPLNSVLDSQRLCTAPHRRI